MTKKSFLILSVVVVLLIVSLVLVIRPTSPERFPQEVVSSSSPNYREQWTSFGLESQHEYEKLTPGGNSVKVRTVDFDIQILKDEELPHYSGSFYPAEFDYPADDNGVIVFIMNDRSYYHPVMLAQYGLGHLNNYLHTGNRQSLNIARKFADKLLEVGVSKGEALFFPYLFNFSHENDPLVAPWYSGMAQGQALSLFSRLYKVTGEDAYLQGARQSIVSLEYLRASENQDDIVWVVHIDDEGYYWIEEYPIGPNGDQTLNGFIFAMYGLYDYYLLTDDPMAQELFKASVATILHYIPQYRNPDEVSYYSLRYKDSNEEYHRIHIQQLTTLYKMSGLKYFQTMADAFYEDHH